MSPKRPPTIKGDDERIAAGREFRRPPTPIPAEVDPEITPPPSEPPDITSLPGFDELAPEIREPLLSLYNAQRELDVGMTRLWDARHVPEQIKRLQMAITVLLQRTHQVDEFTRAVNQHAGQLHRFTVWAEERNKLEARLADTLEGLDHRLDTIERDYAGFNATLSSTAAQIKADIAQLVRSLDAEISERRRGDEAEAIKREALELRVRSLEDSRTKARGAWWVLAPIIAALGAAFGMLGTHLVDWLRGGSAQK